MKDVDKYLTPEVATQIREKIIEAGGNEIFFTGKFDSDKRVHKIDVIARGNEFAVPMVEASAMRSDVVIHNHPSGLLSPSTNDLMIARQLADFSIASYIVNNDVTEIYVIIEPLSKEEEKKLDIQQICQALEPGSIVAKKLRNYEHRPQQIDMIKHVAQAFNEKKIAVVEAGTGVGKSLAYLIPAIHWSLQNRERCVVSTRTINLQEQLIKKDIPFLQKTIDANFKAVLVKGRGNYVCKRKIAALEQNQGLIIEDKYQEEIKAIIEWSKQSKDGSKSDLNMVPSYAVWERVASESDNCQRNECPFFQQCFVTKARREATQANLLVSNHHLLFSDLALRSVGVEAAVLPKYHHIILDEAHNIEDIATDYFGQGVTRIGIMRILHRLFQQTKKAATGYLPLIMSQLQKLYYKHHDETINSIIVEIKNELIPQCEAAVSLNNQLMDNISEFVGKVSNNNHNETRLRINKHLRSQDFWTESLIPEITNFTQLLNRLASGLQSMTSKIEDMNIKLDRKILSTKIDIDSQRNRLKAITSAIESIALKDDDENVRWIEVAKRSTSYSIVRLQIAPLEIAERMKELVFDNYRTIVMTSATLAIATPGDKDEFHYFSKQIGLHLLENQRVLKRKIPASFDYKTQSITAIPLDISDPNSHQFADSISKFIFESLKITDGRAFILFTSYGLLNKVFYALEPKIRTLGYTCLRQGQSNRHQLLQTFKKDKTSVLFATDSFWQGVDVEGDALESVIITKLPFKVPSEPIIEARMEEIERRGGNAFMEYSVPQAVLKLKQGFGRLIRKRTDRGVIFILDKRIIEKFYGKIFIKSLPESHISSGSSEHILVEVRQFIASAKKQVTISE